MLLSLPATRRYLLCFCLLAFAALRAQPPASAPFVPNFEPVSWLPSAVPVLQQAAVKREGIETAERRSDIGDTVTVLAQSRDGARVRQWAVVLSIQDTKPEEKKLRSAPFSIYVSDGAKIAFPPSELEGILIHVFGPFSDDRGAGRAKAVWSGALVNPQFLGLGLDGTAALWQRLVLRMSHDAAFQGKTFGLGVSSSPFPSEEMQRMKPLLSLLEISPAEERAYAGSIPALIDFFRIASQTPGVRDIIFDAVDVPWWSIVKKGGRVDDTHFEFLWPFEALPPADWGLPANVKVYSMGLQLRLNGKPALNCRLALTAPKVPLMNTAGIIGISAVRPDGKGPHLMFRLMAGQPAEAKPALVERK